MVPPCGPGLMGWPRLASTLRSGGARSSFWNGMFTDGMNAGSFRKNSVSVPDDPVQRLAEEAPGAADDVDQPVLDLGDELRRPLPLGFTSGARDRSRGRKRCTGLAKVR